jgi:lipocalin
MARAALWPFTANIIIDLDPDYRWAVIVASGHLISWVLARERNPTRPMKNFTRSGSKGS